MKTQRACHILQALVQGIDPLTGDELPPGTILQQADVLRALLAGISALEYVAERESRRSKRPPNVGRAWSEAEVTSLVAAYKRGEPLDKLGELHGRTTRAIQARLELLGLIAPDAKAAPAR